MLRAGVDEFPAERVQGDLRAVPLRSQSLDGVWANACLLHLSPPELAEALSEIHRVLRAPGYLHLTVKQGIGSGFDTTRYGRPRWFQYWSADELDGALDDARLRVIETAVEARKSTVWLVRQCELATTGR